MKNYTIFFILALLAYSTDAADLSIKTKENIQKVTIFRNSAQIESKVRVNLQTGVYTVLVQHLPINLSASSIQVMSKSNLSILSVETEPNFIENPLKSPEIIDLEDSIEHYSYLLEIENINKFALDQEESLLLSNKTLDNKTSTALDVEDMAVMYRNILPKIKLLSYEKSKKIKKLSEHLKALQNTHKELTQYKKTRDLKIHVSIPNVQTAEFEINYVIPDVHWTPVYDIRVKDISSPIQLINKAHIVQRSGIDWNDVAIVLSTGNPVQNGVKPVLKPWLISLQDPQQIQSKTYEMTSGRISSAQPRSIGALAAVPNAIVSETQLTDIYELTNRYSIPSGTSGKSVEIQNINIPAKYIYMTIPKLDQRAYLTAKIYDWDTYNLLSGKANVFFEGAYVGETFINTSTDEDTLELSLGSDKNIFIKYTKVNEMSSRSTLGSTRKLNLGYEISVRNSKSKTIDLEILDQIPISQDKLIEVKLLNASSANYDAAKGHLKWQLKINENASEKLNFNYELKYPKDKSLNGFF